MTASARLALALAGRYRVERELGQGGMATVYLAHDLRHDRDVAIKVLHPDLGAALGGERFLSEIRTTARLQHPHILPLLDSGEADGLLYYVMPLVTGETLRTRLERERQLPVAELVRIAREVADALGYAHGQNVIHRDIKPENILLQGGHALVADFGIALAVQQAGGQRMTQTGLSLGTPQYMSPEQAMGERAIDARSDIYALGAVTYEMLVGEAPFTGPTVQAIVARLITEEPRPIASQRKAVPPEVEDAVMTALAKLPADRFATAAEMSAALSGGTPARTAVRRSHPVARAPGAWRTVSLGLGALVLALAALSVWALRRPVGSAAPAVFDAALPDSAAMTFGATTATTSYGLPTRNISVAPNGDFVVYAATLGDSTGLWYRSLRDATSRFIAGTIGATAPRVSPDGARVAFLVGGRVMVVPVAGGEPRRIRDGQAPMLLQWTSPTTVLLGDLDGVRHTWIDPEAGQPRSVTGPRCGFGFWLADARELLCSVNGAASITDPETGQRTQLRSAHPDGTPGGLVVGSSFRVVDGRYLVYLTADGDLNAAPYDGAQRLAGRSVTLVSGIRREAPGEGQYDLTASGALVYAPGADAAIGRLVRLAAGRPPELLPLEGAVFQRFDLSRDRRWLAAVVQTAEGQELRIHDLRDAQRFTWLRAEYIRHPIWGPDGQRLMVAVRDSNQWTMLTGSPASGTPPDTLHTEAAGAANFDPIDFASDTLVLVQGVTTFAAARFDPTRRPIRFDTLVNDTRFISISPDARHIAYGEANGRIVVTTLRPGGRIRQVATDGTEPLWLSPGEILYRSGVSWFLARIDPRTGEPLGSPAFWARDPRFSDTSGWSNRPSNDGGIIYLQGPTQVAGGYLRVIPGWVATMKAAVDAANP